MSSSDIRLNVRCHCQDTSFSLNLSESLFPLKSALCHCKSCRHATGQLFATFAVVPAPMPDEIRGSGSEHLAEYRSSATFLRLFCKRCGASIANIDTAGEEEEWELTTGSIEFSDNDRGHEGKLNRVQLWVEAVGGDGGASGWVNAGRLAGMDRHWRGRESEIVSDGTVKNILERAERAHQQQVNEKAQRDIDGKLNVHCHCGNVAFNISRPGSDHNHGTGKFEANLDACTSCRLVTGFEITSWATVPQNLINTTASDIESYLLDSTKLKHYKTSTTVSRYFCPVCGATIFYMKHGLDTIDIGIGVLDPEVSEKARVEDWLSWLRYPKSLCYQEDAVDKKFVSDLAEGIRLHKGEEND